MLAKLLCVGGVLWEACPMKKTFLIILISSVSVIQISCANKIKEAVRDVKYSAYEAVGYEKRDLFKRQVSKVKGNQDDSAEDFKDSLERLKAVYNFDGGNLEKEYSKLKSAYDDTSKSADEVRQSIVQLNTIATDLFKEWSKEITQISSADLRSKSQNSYDQTQKKYKAYYSQLKKSETRMDPVLKKMNDQVLFLKHNLNAAAIAGLKAEAGRIESDIAKLIEEMNKSIKEADELISTMGS